MLSKSQDKKDFLIGVISDTHGLLRPGVAKLFKNVDMIIHAGDVDSSEVFHALEKIAPVKAVLGNMDFGELAKKLPRTEVVEVGAVSFYMLHDMYRLDLDPEAAGFHAVISGHTHRPVIEKKNGVLFFNPGSAGPRRRDYPISAGLLHVRGTSLEANIVELDA